MIAPIEKNRIASYYQKDAIAEPADATDASSPSLQRFRDLIGSHPAAALIAAAAFGAAAAWVVKRGAWK
jgi:hypothetical protein